MSSYLANHPISHAFVMNVLVGAFTLAFVLNIVTIQDVFKLPANVWPRTAVRARWVVAGVVSILLFCLRLAGFVTLKGRDYQRWSVVPKPGHLDEVLLDIDSGTVICP